MRPTRSAGARHPPATSPPRAPLRRVASPRRLAWRSRRAKKHSSISLRTAAATGQGGRALSPRIGKNTHPGMTQYDRGVAVTGSAAAAGSGAGNVRAGLGRRRQCIQSHHVEQPSRTPRRHCPPLHAVHTMEGPPHSHTPFTAAAQPAFDPVYGSPAAAVTTYKEDIRDFDIYKITRTGEEGQYPRLPSLPTQSDSDTDDGLAGTHKTLRRRKRRNPESRLAGSKRLHREEQQTEHTMSVEPNAATLLSSALHQSATTTLPATPSHPSLPLPCASPATQGHCRVSDDRSEGVVNDECDEDDDDETSTVVPEDFANDTDSDIEVLVQSESWVDLSNQPGSPDRVTPLPFGNGEEYLRLLREAQRESNQSSARVSLASSRRDTPRDSPHDSPKSPPNSPNTEMATFPEEAAMLRGVYINYYNKEGDFIRVEKNTETDWIWDSRPDQTPPKEWRFSHPRKGVSRGASIRRVMVGNSSLFSRDVLYTLLITNVLSLLIGTGIGIWLVKRSGSEGIITLPLN
ncbi:uncharacterized protein LOC135099841 isoform X2 [Scylla paramamosain]|uniref:uncharacterized protein LOC135099841 isoform X2 n=1 Tax=Scylla paramamosain TaxID=85552 RepID=UPI003083ED8B